jgi:hypothetical protein
MFWKNQITPALSARFVAAAEIRAINRNRAGKCFVRLLSGDRLTEFLQENERRLVLTIKSSAQLQRAMPLGAVYEKCGRQQIVGDASRSILTLARSEWGALFCFLYKIRTRVRRKALFF